MKAKLILVQALFLGASLVCLDSSAKTVKLSFALHTGGGSPFFELLKRELTGFEAANPGIRVTLQTYPEYFDKMIVMMAAGSAPDIMFSHINTLGQWASTGCLLNVSKMAKADGYDLTDFHPMSLQMLSWAGSLYGIPDTLSSNALYYNKNMLGAAGLGSPTASSLTWDDLAEMATKLTKDSDGNGKPEQWGLESTILQNDGQWFNVLRAFGGNMVEAGKSSASSKGSVAAFRFLYDLYSKRHAINPIGEGGAMPFAGQKVAMLTHILSAIPVYGLDSAKFDWNLAMLPKGPAGRVTRVATAGWSVWSRTKHPKEAWRLVKFLSSPDVALKIGRAGISVPARTSVATSKAFLGNYKQDASVFMAMRDYGSAPPYGPKFAKTLEVWNSELPGLWSGDRSVESVMKRIDQRASIFLRAK